jgi:tetratricopeptide (TPR) repeat protein
LNDRAYSFRAIIANNQNKPQEEITHLTNAIRLNPKEADYYNARGYLYFTLKDYKASLTDLDKAVALAPQEVRVISNRSETLWALGEYEKALADNQQVIQLAPNAAYPHFRRADFYTDLKEYSKSVDEYTLGLARTNQTDLMITAYYNRGLMYLKLKLFEKAIADYNKALELGAADSDVYNNRGNAYAELGQYEKALPDFQKALARNPQNKEAARNLKQLEQLLNKKAH